MSLNKKTQREEDKESSAIMSSFIGDNKKKPIDNADITDMLFETVFKSNGLTKTQCAICARDISLQIKIICGECSDKNKQYIYCLNCLAQLKHPNHDYYLVDKLNFPLFTLDWTMKDELRLISSIEKCGLDNWGDISDNMINRGKVECESHYYTFYYQSKDVILPKEESVILKSIKADGSFEIDNDRLKRNEEREKNEKEIRTLNQGKVPEPTQVNEKSVKNNGRSVIRGNRNKNGESTVQTAGEILGYWPKRDEFDIEFLNDAELEIAELEFLDEDSENDKKLKMEVLKVYNQQLDERKLRKDFIIQKNLLDLKRQNNFESQLSKEDREILNFLKPFARFYDYSEFFDLYEGIVLEKNLKQKLYQLKMYQKQGLKTVEDIQKYLEIDTNGKSKKFNMELAQSHPVNYPMSVLGERVNRFLKYGEGEVNLSDNEKKFIKNFPMPISTFCDIKEKVDSINKENKEEKQSEIDKILSQYDIEKKSLEEISMFFKTEVENNSIAVNNK